ncbi:transcriptional regulator with XRE-family HTH domain [Sporomusaceae bacterium BoRhaA]|uniref:helix-turn-helix domain-containing protein n=1 Tax=Pelorhabdus rhamnosifermentans TaxID=2772457 RepID=UPI001C05FEDF|nr:helix-turn-helix transcriptional regulator [Pelorhabdus rhamnosifermentans]MBU2701310.1 transcriptional regulator with XRE-family HTH domain [Pelorhabdus rhamnosifermentans]
MDNLDQAEPNYKEIGIRLREVRAKLSQTAFGEPLGYKYGYVRDCEHGKKPSLEYLFKVSNFYNVSLEWLLKGIVLIDDKAQKVEAISDPDLKNMIAILRDLMESDDPDLRGWTKVQFKTAFKEYYAAHDEKKL